MDRERGKIEGWKGERDRGYRGWRGEEGAGGGCSDGLVVTLVVHPDG